MQRNMYRLKSSSFPYVFVLVMVAFVLRTGAVQALSRSAGSNSGTWNVVPSPNAGNGPNELYGIASIAPNDIWAVGSYQKHSFGLLYTLTEHWDGTKWSIIHSPNQQHGGNLLRAVAAVSTNDVWAVGNNYRRHGGRLLIEHWDGSQWSIIKTPDVGGNPVLDAITVISTDDAWAVGSYGRSQTLILHWNGSHWSIVNSPNKGPFDFLNGIAAVSANDIWATGEYEQTPSSNDRTLFEHWDGSQWNIVQGANHKGYNNDLNGIVAVSSTEVWAVGNYSSSASPSQTLVEQWDGQQWQIVKSPNAGSNDFLNAVTAVSSTDIWAVGSYDGHTLIEQWSGA